jgi:hypothetical protein
MSPSKRASIILAIATWLGSASAFASDAPTPPIPEAPAAPGLYGIGDLALAPGMTLYLFRPSGEREVEVGRMRVIDVANGEVKLELVSGSARMESGDHLELEVTPPSTWKSFKE